MLPAYIKPQVVLFNQYIGGSLEASPQHELIGISVIFSRLEI
jgi:hypothetical protein